MVCTGNANEICGAANHNSIYKVPMAYFFQNENETWDTKKDDILKIHCAPASTKVKSQKEENKKKPQWMKSNVFPLQNIYIFLLLFYFIYIRNVWSVTHRLWFQNGMIRA